MTYKRSSAEIDNLRQSGKILSGLLNTIIPLVQPGVSLLELENVAATYVRDAGVKGAFIGYPGTKSSYKNILCTSVNEEVVHCPPSKRVLNNGDIVSIDAGVIYNQMYSDCAVTLPVGNISNEAKKLLQVTRDALYVEAQKMLKPGNTTGDIGHAIQTYVEKNGFHIVKQLVGHGIGYQLHEDPSVPNYGVPGTGAKLEPGMTIAIEPMVNFSTPNVVFEDDGWRVVTADGRISAHFEHTYLITEDGYEVLTAL